MSKKKNRRSLISLLVLIGLALLGFFVYRTLFGGKVQLQDKNYTYFFIGHEDTFEDVLKHLDESGISRNQESFEWLARKMELPANLHPGRYRIINGMNMRQIINLLKYNKQEKVKLSFNSQIRSLEEFVIYVDEKLELTEDDLLDILQNEELLHETFRLDPDNAFAMVIPGVYEVSWAITPKEFLDLLKQRYKKLWNADRLLQCKKLGFESHEIVTIASIVQSESSIESEQEKIAGVYINRLKKNMPLQADPTLKFANRNYGAMRVLDSDKEIDSPYNTYKYKGLPPGPICLVGQQAIDATLNYSRHKFLYFCAKPQLNGFSDFSVTYEEHRKYAAAYQKALDKIGISR